MANDIKTTEKKPKKKLPIGQFFKEVAGEVKKLSWITKKELMSYTFAVIGFIIVMAIVVYALDLVFGKSLGLLANL